MKDNGEPFTPDEFAEAIAATLNAADDGCKHIEARAERVGRDAAIWVNLRDRKQEFILTVAFWRST